MSRCACTEYQECGPCARAISAAEDRLDGLTVVLDDDVLERVAACYQAVVTQ